MPLDTLLFLYVAILLTGIGLIALYSEYRRKRFTPAASEDHIFRCAKCAFVYTDDPDVTRSRCPTCGISNEPIKF